MKVHEEYRQKNNNEVPENKRRLNSGAFLLKLEPKRTKEIQVNYRARFYLSQAGLF